MTLTTEAGRILLDVFTVPVDSAEWVVTLSSREVVRHAIPKIEQEARTAALTALRERVILTQLDPCFCDDVGQLPECEACLRVRAVLVEIDRAMKL
jgi:hypothetical protein